MRNLWVRAGVMLNITEEEEKILFSNQYNEGAEIIKRIFAEGRAKPDGPMAAPAKKDSLLFAV